MSFFTFWRRYPIPSLLFSFCLSAVIVFAPGSKYVQPVAAKATVPAIAQGNGALQTSVLVANGAALSLAKDVGKTVLENGLTVLTKEVHTAPVVTVQVWYKIGSRNEETELNGIAHQLEHMMFKGTKERPIQFGRLFSALGSESNAFTSYDQTAYFGTVERDKLRSMLVLEADRMENSVINAEQLKSEKRVVISELEGYENSPSYRLDRAVMGTLYPNSPYGLTVGGTKADVERFTVEAVQRYYEKYYSPNNAILVIVGDFQTEPTLQMVRDIFEKVPNRAGEGVSSVAENAPRPLSGSSPAPIVLRQPGSAPLLQVVYPLPTVDHPDVPAIKVMDYILTGGRSSLIYQALVESGLASDASGYAANLIGAGWYDLSATAASNQPLAKIDRVLQETISQLQTKGVTQEELDRAKEQFRAGMILANRNITVQAMQIADDQLSTGDYTFTDRLLKAIEQVSAADVQRVANQYLNPSSRIVGYFEPTQVTAESGTTTGNSNQTSENFNLGPPVDPAEVAKYLPESSSSSTSIARSLPETFTLPNGLKVLLLADNSTPTVTLSGYVQAGSEFDLVQKAGIASMTADNLMNGTKTKDALTLAKTLEDRGASLGFSSAREGVTVAGYSLSKDLPILVDTLSDVLQNASFPQDQLELSRQRSLTELQERLDNPTYLAYRTLQQTVYPNQHPFHTYPSSESLRNITDEDVMAFYQRHYRPDTTVLTLVGDFELQKVRSLLEEELGGWRAVGKPPTLTFPGVPMPEKVVRLNPVIPGKAQAITYMGYRGIDRQDPRYYGAMVLNQIVGGDAFASRLGAEIRDRQGLTYGIYSYFQAGEEPGMFVVNMQTSPADTTKAISGTLALLEQVRDRGVSAAEVETAKRSLISGYTVQLADPDYLTSEILMNEVYGLSTAELRNFVTKIQAVTQQEVNQVGKELLHPQNFVVVVAGPSVSAVSR